MTDAISFEALDLVESNSVGRQQANQQDKVRFENELSDNDVLVFTDEGFKAQGSEKIDGPASNIIDKIDSAHRNYRENLSALQNDLLRMDQNGFSAKDAVKLQFRVAQLHIQSSVTTSIANKAHDGLKTLFKQA